MKRVIRPIFATSDSFTFQSPVIWKVRTVLSVPAHSMREAIQIVNSHEYELPEGEYVKDSFKIDYDRLES